MNLFIFIPIMLDLYFNILEKKILFNSKLENIMSCREILTISLTNRPYINLTEFTIGIFLLLKI